LNLILDRGMFNVTIGSDRTDVTGGRWKRLARRIATQVVGSLVYACLKHFPFVTEKADVNDR
jgi:hypothetical protein